MPREIGLYGTIQVLFCVSLMFVVLSGLSHVCFENIFKRISSSNDCIVLNVIRTPTHV